MKRTAYLTCALLCVAGHIGCGDPGGSAPESATAAPGVAAKTSGGTTDTCALLTPAEIAEAVGNPVQKGTHPDMDSMDCKWDTDTQGDVGVLLIVYRAGSIREQALCPDLRKKGKAAGFENVAEASTWSFESVIGLFNSGAFEGCGPKGFLSLQLNGKRDEAKLKQATAALIGKILARL